MALGSLHAARPVIRRSKQLGGKCGHVPARLLPVPSYGGTPDAKLHFGPWSLQIATLEQGDQNCLLSSLQTCLWCSWYPVLAEQSPAASRRYTSRTSPLLSLGRCWALPRLPVPVGQLFSWINGCQFSDSPGPGTKWDFRLAAEIALAQILSCVQTTHNGEGRVMDLLGGSYEWACPCCICHAADRMTASSGKDLHLEPMMWPCLLVWISLAVQNKKLSAYYYFQHPVDTESLCECLTWVLVAYLKLVCFFLASS